MWSGYTTIDSLCSTLQVQILGEIMDQLFSIEQAAVRLGGISKWTVHAWLAKGKLRRTKVGSRTMIRERDLQAFLDECNPDSSSEAGTINQSAKPRLISK